MMVSLRPIELFGVGLNVDYEGWRPNKGQTDKDGNVIEDRIYNTKDYDRTLVIHERTDMVAKKANRVLKKVLTDFLKLLSSVLILIMQKECVRQL